jgi:hypothetical protein
MHVRHQPAPAAVVDTPTPSEPAPAPEVLAEAVAVIDHGLVTMAYRQLVTAAEVSDLLLDLRVVLLVAELELAGRATPTAV